MIQHISKTPVLFVICEDNIEIVKTILYTISKVEPLKLYIVCDCPESMAVESYFDEIKKFIADIHWKCQINTIFNKKALGYDRTLLKAVRHFFSNELKGIVLDGRVVPPTFFFTFCSILLEKYRDDERIGHICGRNFLREEVSGKESYSFSRLIDTSHGWASWQRVWKNFDAEIKTFSSFKKRSIIESIPTHKPFLYQWHHLNYLNHSWTAKYEYINLINNRLSIVPNINLYQLSYADEVTEIIHPTFIVDNIADDLKLQEFKYSLPAVTRNEPPGYAFMKAKLLSFSSEAANRMKIPRIIHQIYEDPKGPSEELLAIAQTWKDKHPDWEYRFWNRTMINDFLESTCPDFYAYYRAYPFNVQRWDAIRYLILYYIGGLYLDMDYECIEPMDVLLTDSACCMGMEPTVNCRIHLKPLIVGNALMAAAPKHKYFEQIIQDMKDNFYSDYGKGDAMQIMETTGPFMVTRVYEQFQKKSEITLLSADLIAPLSIKEVWMLRMGFQTAEMEENIEKSFAIHYFFGSWTPQTAEGKKK